MSDVLPAWVGDIAPVPIIVGIVWAFYWLISSGRLIPKSTMDLLIAANDKVNAVKDSTIASQEKQIDALLESNKTTKHALESLQQAAAERSVNNASSS